MRTQLTALIFALFSLIGCENMIESKNSYLALGDSYTIGESVEPSQRWPVQLVDDLRTVGFNIEQPRIIARTGWTTDELMAAMDTSELNPPYDMVSLLIGVNNQYRGRDTANYREELGILMDRAIELAGDDPGKVFIVSIPDWGVTPFAQQQGRNPANIAEEINTYNSIKQEMAKRKSLEYINITDISREAGNKPEYLADDGLHPSGKMYNAWVERIFPVARDILDNK